MNPVVTDIGQIAALLIRRDRHHVLVRVVLDSIEPPICTVKALIQRPAFYSDALRGQDAMLEMLASDVVHIGFPRSAEITAVQVLMQKFVEEQTSLAGCGLVRMTKLDMKSVLVSLDGDFCICPWNWRQTIPTILHGSAAGSNA